MRNLVIDDGLEAVCDLDEEHARVFYKKFQNEYLRADLAFYELAEGATKMFYTGFPIKQVNEVLEAMITHNKNMGA